MKNETQLKALAQTLRGIASLLESIDKSEIATERNDTDENRSIAEDITEEILTQLGALGISDKSTVFINSDQLNGWLHDSGIAMPIKGDPILTVRSFASAGLLPLVNPDIKRARVNGKRVSGVMINHAPGKHVITIDKISDDSEDA